MTGEKHSVRRAFRRSGNFLAAGLTFFLVGACGSDVPASNYVLGPGDQISVYLRDLKEIEIKPSVIGLDGNVELAYAGKMHAEGLTTEALAREIEQRLSTIVRAPNVTVQVTDYGSQPVSVLGAVNKPGVHQLRGRKTLIEVLSMAEGLKNEAGNVIKITRPTSSGPIPLPNSRMDASSQFTTAEVNIKALLEARSPEDNILVRPHDVILIPRADLIYVMGGVKKPGGFPLAERESMTVLQAIAMAEGVDAEAAPAHAKILRYAEPGSNAKELPINVKKILTSEAPDQPLRPNDVLFIPNSATQKLSIRILEAGLQMGTGLVIWRR